ncbi:MAG: 50S ribosomal protein L3 [Candidatus Aquicultorales bacterium]
MKALLGKKLGMTQVFVEGDRLLPVTVLEAGPCVVTQVKREATDGYSAIQIGFEEVPDRKVTKPLKGHFAKGKIKPVRHLAEIRVDNADEFTIGQSIDASIFETGEKADVSGISKGKGYQGVVRRHGFSGGPASHGAHFHRAPGSIGMAATPSRVLKGSRMPGQMGNARTTVKNLEIVRVDLENNVILVKGAVPGANGSLVMVKSAK